MLETTQTEPEEPARIFIFSFHASINLWLGLRFF